MVIAGTIAGIFLAPLFQKDKGNDYDPNAVDIVQQSNDGDSQTFANNIAIPCWDSLTMTANQLEQSVNFYNPKANKGINLSLSHAEKLYIILLWIYPWNQVHIMQSWIMNALQPMAYS